MIRSFHIKMTNSHSGSGSARVESTEEPFRTWMRYHMQSEDESDSVTNSRHTTRSVTATPEHATGGTHLAGWDGGDGYCRLAPYLHSTPGHAGRGGAAGGGAAGARRGGGRRRGAARGGRRGAGAGGRGGGRPGQAGQ